MHIVILAAGVGSRLGRPIPKPLTVIGDGRSILQRQTESLTNEFRDAPIIVVTGVQEGHVKGRVPGGAVRLQRTIRRDQHRQESASGAREHR